MIRKGKDFSRVGKSSLILFVGLQKNRWNKTSSLLLESFLHDLVINVKKLFRLWKRGPVNWKHTNITVNERSYHFEDACFLFKPTAYTHWNTTTGTINLPHKCLTLPFGCSGSHSGNGDPVLRSLVCRQMAASRWNFGLPKVGSAHRRICDVYIIFL